MTIYGRSEELVSRCVECDLAEPESLASLGGCAPGLVDGILSHGILDIYEDVQLFKEEIKHGKRVNEEKEDKGKAAADKI